MNLKTIQIKVEEYPSMEALPDKDRDLMQEAEKAMEKAYAEYSHFRVGAALRLANGKIITGNNQENAAYPSGLCAERVAMFYARSQYPDAVIESLAICARGENFRIRDAVAPCGACRQVMAEYQTQQQQDMRVIMKGQEGPILAVDSVNNLLPLMFHVEELKKNK